MPPPMVLGSSGAVLVCQESRKRLFQRIVLQRAALRQTVPSADFAFRRRGFSIAAPCSSAAMQLESFSALISTAVCQMFENAV